VYIYGSREDHIVPWTAAYRSTRLFDGNRRFVLGASGHIAGVINPPAKGKRSHWINAKLPAKAEAWFDGATEHPGSWWTDWSAGSPAMAASWWRRPRRYGNRQLQGHRAGTRPLRQGQGLTLSRGAAPAPGEPG
jgi:polyhydroxyalkanoate synthase